MLWMAEHQLQKGKYVIKEILGAGGYGITYKALHADLDTYVAIKTVNKTISSLGELEYQKYVLSFKKEGQTLEKLSKKFHSNIVRVRDFFEEDGFPCLVMDFVEGETLMQLVQRKQALSQGEILSYIRQISEALSTVHKVGLVHRDVQPCNILIQEDGKAVLIDFGIAKSQFSLTQNSLTVSGTRSYAPKEQFEGNRKPTVDIFALAGTLYYGITGRHPENSFDRRIMEVELTPPKQLIPQISDQLNDAIVKGMALNAEDRPQSIQEWVSLLDSAFMLCPSNSISLINSQNDEFIFFDEPTFVKIDTSTPLINVDEKLHSIVPQNEQDFTDLTSVLPDENDSFNESEYVTDLTSVLPDENDSFNESELVPETIASTSSTNIDGETVDEEAKVIDWSTWSGLVSSLSGAWLCHGVGGFYMEAIAAPPWFWVLLLTMVVPAIFGICITQVQEGLEKYSGFWAGVAFLFLPLALGMAWIVGGAFLRASTVSGSIALAPIAMFLWTAIWEFVLVVVACFTTMLAASTLPYVFDKTSSDTAFLILIALSLLGLGAGSELGHLFLGT